MADDGLPYVAQSALSPFTPTDPGPDTVYSTADVNRIQEHQARRSGLSKAIDYVRSWLPHAEEHAGRQSAPEALQAPQGVSLAARLEDAPRRALNIAAGIPDAVLGTTGHYADWQHHGRDAHAEFDPLSVAVGPLAAAGFTPGLRGLIAKGEANPFSTADWARAKWHGANLDDLAWHGLDQGMPSIAGGGGITPPVWPGEEFVGDRADINQQNPYSPRAAMYRERMEELGRFGETWPRAPEFQAGHNWNPEQGNVTTPSQVPSNLQAPVNNAMPFNSMELRDLWNRHGVSQAELPVAGNADRFQAYHRGEDVPREPGPNPLTQSHEEFMADRQKFIDKIEDATKEVQDLGRSRMSQDELKYEDAANKQADARERKSKLKVVPTDPSEPFQPPDFEGALQKLKESLDKDPTLHAKDSNELAGVVAGRRTQPLPLTSELMKWIKDAGKDTKTWIATGPRQTDYVRALDPVLQERGIKPTEFRVPSDNHLGSPRAGRIDTSSRSAGDGRKALSTRNVEGGKFADRQNLVDVVKWALSKDPIADGNWLVPNGKEPRWARYSQDEPPAAKQGPFAGDGMQAHDDQLMLLAKNQNMPLLAAIRTKNPDGTYRTFTGANHGEAWDKAVQALGEQEAGRRSYGAHDESVFDKPGEDPVAGFLDSNGEYVTREASKQRLKARGVDVGRDTMGSFGLTSEALEDIKAERPDLYAKGGNDSWWQKIVNKVVGRDPEDPAAVDPKVRMNMRLARRIMNEPEVAKAAGDFYARDRGPNDTLHAKAGNQRDLMDLAKQAFHERGIERQDLPEYMAKRPVQGDNQAQALQYAYAKKKFNEGPEHGDTLHGKTEGEVRTFGILNREDALKQIRERGGTRGARAAREQEGYDPQAANIITNPSPMAQGKFERVAKKSPLIQGIRATPPEPDALAMGARASEGSGMPRPADIERIHELVGKKGDPVLGPREGANFRDKWTDTHVAMVKDIMDTHQTTSPSRIWQEFQTRHPEEAKALTDRQSSARGMRRLMIDNAGKLGLDLNRRFGSGEASVGASQRYLGGNPELVQRFRAAAEKHGGSLSKVADEMGMGQASVSRWLNRMYSPKELEALRQARNERMSQAERIQPELERRNGKTFWDENGKLESAIRDQAAALKAVGKGPSDLKAYGYGKEEMQAIAAQAKQHRDQGMSKDESRALFPDQYNQGKPIDKMAYNYILRKHGVDQGWGEGKGIDLPEISAQLNRSTSFVPNPWGEARLGPKSEAQNRNMAKARDMSVYNPDRWYADTELEPQLGEDKAQAREIRDRAMGNGRVSEEGDLYAGRRGGVHAFVMTEGRRELLKQLADQGATKKQMVDALHAHPDKEIMPKIMGHEDTLVPSQIDALWRWVEQRREESKGMGRTFERKAAPKDDIPDVNASNEEYDRWANRRRDR